MPLVLEQTLELIAAQWREFEGLDSSMDTGPKSLGHWLTTIDVHAAALKQFDELGPDFDALSDEALNELTGALMNLAVVTSRAADAASEARATRES